MRHPTQRSWWAAIVLLIGATPAAAALTEGQRVAAVYDTILQARFDQVDEQLKETCPPAPNEACQALRAASAWWEIQLTPDNRRRDARFNTLATAAVAASEAWTRREPQAAEAWFYLAASYGPLVQWRVLRGDRLAAAREGKKIKDALERALRLDPQLQDAYFGIGLYHYYAAVAPAAVKILRFVLLLPGGDRVTGLREMLQARDRGEVLRSEADYQLQLVYLWYERKPLEALRILQRLDARYTHNPLFLRQIAAVHDTYLNDHPASAAAWRRLVVRATAGRVYDSAPTALGARLGLAAQLDAMFETDRAIDELKVVSAASSDVLDAGTRARAQMLLASAYDRLGQRQLAVQAYKAAIAEAPSDDADRIRARATAALREPPDSKSAQAYRLSLEGWRAFERGEIETAEASLTKALALSPADIVARYRYARVLEARGDGPHARAELEKVIGSDAPPPVIASSALVAYARLLEASDDTTRALALYRQAIDARGGDPRARDEARRAAKRLETPTKK